MTPAIHKRPGGSVLASVEYEREGVGVPTKITHEDGSVVLLGYDAALRLERESYHGAGGDLLEEITYEYDAAGNRLRRTDPIGSQVSTYLSGHRLGNVDGPGTDDEAYSYDANGNVANITRNGRTLTLNYDAYGRLFNVGGVSGEGSVQYVHDALGRRVRASDMGGSTRQLVVAPTPGNRLQSPILITDSSGSILSSYVYAGRGPLMRFDGSGQAVYYLEDGMGSIIGLSDENAQQIANIQYDGFGNIRQATGPAANPSPAVGGDFRFHGAWLESATGLYHMRARDYDPVSGRFLSRDPLGPDLRTPESIHPYSFAYANPHYYTDPTGAFTLIELQSVNGQQITFQTLKAEASRRGRNYARRKIAQALSNVLSDRLKGFIPFFDNEWFQSLSALVQGNTWEWTGVRQAFCKELHLPRELWLAPGVYYLEGVYSLPGLKTGDVSDNGLNCASPDIAWPIYGGIKHPDFIFSKDPPDYHQQGKGGRGYLVGDFKLSSKTVYEGYRPGGNKRDQWEAMAGYAKDHGWRVAFIAVLFEKKGYGEKELALIMQDAVVSGHFFAYIFILIDTPIP